MAWNTRGLENPSSDEFLNNPDFRQIVAFFLGWVFFYSVQTIFSSPLLQENFARACSSFLSLITKPIQRRHEPNDIETNTHPGPANTLRHGEKAQNYNTRFNNSSSTSRLRTQEGDALLVTLALCFACASVAHFASLLRYTTSGETPCGFVVAWGGTAAQAGRLTGLLILTLELKKLGVRHKEIHVLWVLLLVLLGLIFANNAIAVGVLRAVPSLRISLCYRRHFAPTGLASSLALILFELYLIVRFTVFISPKGLGWFSQLDLLRDFRVYRALSLLLLDTLAITSAAKPTNLLVDFVPFAVGAVVVLFAYNSGSSRREKEVAPSWWSCYNETRRFALYPTPASSMASTLSIRRISNCTMYAVSLPSPGYSETEPPPAPTRPTLSLDVALRNFTTQEQLNSRAVIDGHTRVKVESPTSPSPVTVQSRRSTRSSAQRRFPMHSENPGTQYTRRSLKRGKRPQMAPFISPDEEVPGISRLREGSSTPHSGVYTADFLRTPTPRKRSNRTKRSSTSSGLTYMTPVSQKTTPSRRPSYLLSPSKSYQQSMSSTSHTPVPTWEDMYRQQGPQFDPRLEIPPVPSLNRHLVSPYTPVVLSVPPIERSARSPPPGLTKFQPITRSSLLANTPPVERVSGVRGPRPLVTTSRSRYRT